MEMIRFRLTRGDTMTQPGGVCLRRKADGTLVAHSFAREWGSKEPTSFFWGAYGDEATAAYADKLSRCGRYDAGGSLIPQADEDSELAKEKVHEDS